MDIYCLSTKVDYISKEELFNEIDTGNRISVIGCAAHNVVRAYKDPMLQNYINFASYRIADGVPLTWPYYIINKNKISRFNGMDVVENYFFNENSFRHFFIGSSEEILKEAHRNILEKNSKFNLVGTYIPPFSDVSEWKFDEIIQKIENCNANFIWVGVGSLKQEELMYRIKVVNPDLNMYSAGAAFDWVAGKTKRAPNLFKVLGLEWFYRLLAEPTRLWKRYLVDNTLFLYLFIRQLLTKEKFRQPLEIKQ